MSKQENCSLVLKSIKKLGAAMTDDVEKDIGPLPNRGISYSFTELKKRGDIEFVRKHANGKGMYRVKNQVQKEKSRKVIGDPAVDKKISDHMKESIRLIQSRKKGEGIQNVDHSGIKRLKALLHEGMATLEKYDAVRHEQSPLHQ